MEEGPDVEIDLTKDVLVMETQDEEDVGIGEEALEEEGPAPQVYNYDSLLGEIDELKFLLGKP